MTIQRIVKESGAVQIDEPSLNLVGPTTIYLDSEILRINHDLAKKFERLNAGVSE